MKWKTVIGIILIILSIAVMYLWESRLKDEVTQTEILVPIRDIGAGEAVLISNLKTLKINPAAKIDNALRPSDAESINGKVCTQKLVANQQLLGSYFLSREELQPEGYINFVIPSDWIYSKSSLIGAKDKVDFYVMPEKTYIGSYRIDLVNQNSIEVISRLEDYYRIYDFICSGGKLLLVMKEDV